MIQSFIKVIAAQVVAVAVILVVSLGIGGMNKNATVTTKVALPYVEPSQYNMLWASEFTEGDVDCLAQNIYFEARGEEDDGKYAVAEVVMHRMMNHRYAHTVCGVVREGRYRGHHPVRHMCQFSWWCDGRSDKVTDITAFERSREIAEEVLFDPDYDQKMEYALFYHNHTVNPHWVTGVNFVATFGSHTFYR